MPLARADSSYACAVPRLCSMNAAPQPRPRMETLSPVRPSFRRSTGRDSALADGEAARDIKTAMAPPKRVRRMNPGENFPFSWSKMALDSSCVNEGSGSISLPPRIRWALRVKERRLRLNRPASGAWALTLFTVQLRVRNDHQSPRMRGSFHYLPGFETPEYSAKNPAGST
jgi:hypothetical protein